MSGPTLLNSPDTQCEIQASADFSRIRYSQCWEDADILIKALAIEPHHHVLSIGSAGDNVFSILSRSPGKVTAIDLSSAQLALIELKVSAFKMLKYEELLTMIGVMDGDRLSLYRRLGGDLSLSAREYWDAHQDLIARGLGHIGKFENYFAMFRGLALPLVHSGKSVQLLLSRKDRTARDRFYVSRWNTPQWRAMFRIFFSRKLMGLLGRDPAFFRYVDRDVAGSLMDRVKHALTSLDPIENPYLQWILTGTFQTALPHYLRPENFESIRSNLYRLDLRQVSLEAYLESSDSDSIHGFNLSDVFEYTSSEKYIETLRSLIRVSAPGGRLVYWNMLAPRSRPESLATSILPLSHLSDSLFAQDKAFFYSKFVVEEIQK